MKIMPNLIEDSYTTIAYIIANRFVQENYEIIPTYGSDTATGDKYVLHDEDYCVELMKREKIGEIRLRIDFYNSVIREENAFALYNKMLKVYELLNNMRKGVNDEWEKYYHSSDDSDKAEIMAYLIKYKDYYKISDKFIEENKDVIRQKRSGLWDFNTFVKENLNKSQKDDAVELFYKCYNTNSVDRHKSSIWGGEIDQVKIAKKQAKELIEDIDFPRELKEEFSILYFMYAMDYKWYKNVLNLGSEVRYKFSDNYPEDKTCYQIPSAKIVKNKIKHQIFNQIKDKLNDETSDLALDLKEFFNRFGLNESFLRISDYEGDWIKKYNKQALQYTLSYIYDIFVKCIPNWLKRGKRGSLWGMKTESIWSHNIGSPIFTAFNEGTEEEMFDAIIDFVVSKNASLYNYIDEFDNLAIVDDSSRNRLTFSYDENNKNKPNIHINVGNIGLNFPRDIQEVIFNKAKNVFYKLYDFSINVSKKKKSQQCWLDYFEQAEDTKKSQLYQYILNTRDVYDFDLSEEWLEDNKHYLRSKKGGLWSFKEFIQR